MAILPIGNYPLIPFGGNPIQNVGSLIVMTTALYALSNIPRASAADHGGGSGFCKVVCVITATGYSACTKTCEFAEMAVEAGKNLATWNGLKGIVTIGGIAGTLLMTPAWWGYDAYMKSDDKKLIERIYEPNCGGAADMPRDVQACFKSYLLDAADRVFQSGNSEKWKTLDARIVECFPYDRLIRIGECGWTTTNPLKWKPD